MSLTELERAEVEAAVAPLPAFDRGRLRALAAKASGDDLQRINALLRDSPATRPVATVNHEAVAAGVARGRNWKWRP